MRVCDGMAPLPPCAIDVMESKAGLRVRLLAKQVFVSGWELVLDVHKLIELVCHLVHCLHHHISLKNGGEHASHRG